jgi:hypothetical protein
LLLGGGPHFFSDAQCQIAQPGPRLGWELFIGFAFGLSNVVHQIGIATALEDLGPATGYPTNGKSCKSLRRAFRVLPVEKML